MRRFYQAASVARADDGNQILLDDRPIKTPARAPLVVPSHALAKKIAHEWDAQGETIHPRSMPMTGLANAAIDRIRPDPETFALGLAIFGETDLLCYRAEAPAGLVARQAELWDPPLAWARRRYDVNFEVVQGIMHRPQPQATVERLAHAVRSLSAFELAGLSPLVTISGSLVIALALLEDAAGLDEGWAAGTVDEQWQIDQWGEDAEAVARLAARRAEFEAGWRFLKLL